MLYVASSSVLSNLLLDLSASDAPRAVQVSGVSPSPDRDDSKCCLMRSGKIVANPQACPLRLSGRTEAYCSASLPQEQQPQPELQDMDLLRDCPNFQS